MYNILRYVYILFLPLFFIGVVVGFIARPLILGFWLGFNYIAEQQAVRVNAKRQKYAAEYVEKTCK